MKFKLVKQKVGLPPKVGTVLLLAALLGACASNGVGSHPGAITRYEAASTAYESGELSTAETRYLELVKANPQYAEGWFKLGNIYVRTGQLVAAIRMYEKAAVINPEDGKVWNNLALARVKQAVATLDEGAQHVRSGSPEQAGVQELRKRIVAATLIDH